MTDDQTVTQALLPCPFCGGEAEEATSKGPTGERYRWAQCTDCGAMSECCDDSARHNNPEEPEPIDLWNTRTAHSGEGRSNGAGEDLEDHFPTGLRSGYARTAGGVPVQGGGVEIDCRCGWSAKASDEHAARQQWADHARAALSAPQGEVERLREAEHLLRYTRPLVGVARSSADRELADNARLVCQRIDAFFSQPEAGGE